MPTLESFEDCIRALYHLQKEKNRAITLAELQKYFGKTSISTCLREVITKGYAGKINSHYYLTITGVHLGEELTRKHRLIETFLSEFMHIGGKPIHETADKIEHEIDEKALGKMDRLLGSPKNCPHGSVIPVPAKKIMALSAAPAGKQLKVVFTNFPDKDTVERLQSLGVVPYAKVSIINRIEHGPMILSVKGSEVSISEEVSKGIIVKESPAVCKVRKMKQKLRRRRRGR